MLVRVLFHWLILNPMSYTSRSIWDLTLILQAIISCYWSVCFYLCLSNQVRLILGLYVSIFDFTTPVCRIPKSSDTQICMFLSLISRPQFVEYPNRRIHKFVCFYLWLHDPSSSNTQIVEYSNLCVSIFDLTTPARWIPKSVCFYLWLLYPSWYNTVIGFVCFYHWFPKPSSSIIVFVCFVLWLSQPQFVQCWELMLRTQYIYQVITIQDHLCILL